MAEDLTILKDVGKKEKYESLLPQIEGLFPCSHVENSEKLCEQLYLREVCSD